MSEKRGPRSRADSALSNLVLEGGKSRSYKIGRDADTGRFMPVKEAQRRAKTAVVETIKNPKKSKG
jgi:hypothetical protein